MIPLTGTDHHHFEAAQGWLELADWQSANDELENIEPHQRVHPYVLEIRWQVYALAGKWEFALELAEKLMEAKIPDCAERAFKLACHACRLSRVGDARKATKAASTSEASSKAAVDFEAGILCTASE